MAFFTESLEILNQLFVNSDDLIELLLCAGELIGTLTENINICEIEEFYKTGMFNQTVQVLFDTGDINLC